MFISQLAQDFDHVVAIQGRVYLFWRAPSEVEIEQIIVTQVHQGAQCLGLTNGQLRAVALEEPLQDQIIFHLGDPGGLLYIITSGKVKLSHSTPDGQETTAALLARTGTT